MLHFFPNGPYVALHLGEPIRLGFVARHVANTSPGHLARLFHQKHGVNFTEYLRGLLTGLLLGALFVPGLLAWFTAPLVLLDIILILKVFGQDIRIR